MATKFSKIYKGKVVGKWNAESKNSDIPGCIMSGLWWWEPLVLVLTAIKASHTHALYLQNINNSCRKDVYQLLASGV